MTTEPATPAPRCQHCGHYLHQNAQNEWLHKRVGGRRCTRYGIPTNPATYATPEEVDQ